MGLTSLAFLMREGLLNIRRNGLMSLAALSTVTVALTVLGASLWTAYRINEIVEQQPKHFDQVNVFLDMQVTREQAVAVQERIRALPEVKQALLVTRELAWKRLQASEPSLTNALPDNPLPDMLEVEPKQATDLPALTRAFRDPSRFPEVHQIAEAGKEVRTMLGFARVVKVIGGCAAIGLFVATLFIVYNTIRLTVFARRREIRIMQLVGATPGFIRFPLIMEGVFHGVAGALIAGGMLLLCGREISLFVARLKSPLVGDVPSLLGPADVIGGLVAIGAFLGLVGSALSMRRFLRQI